MTDEEKAYKLAQALLLTSKALKLQGEMFEALKDEINDFVLEAIGFDREDRIIYNSLASRIEENNTSVEDMDLQSMERILKLLETKLERYKASKQ